MSSLSVKALIILVSKISVFLKQLFSTFKCLHHELFSFMPLTQTSLISYFDSQKHNRHIAIVGFILNVCWFTDSCAEYETIKKIIFEIFCNISIDLRNPSLWNRPWNWCIFYFKRLLKLHVTWIPMPLWFKLVCLK